jgi:hypothetical protein
MTNDVSVITNEFTNRGITSNGGSEIACAA